MLPTMPCDPIDFGDGVTGHACSRDRRRRSPCVECRARAHTKLCDYPLAGRKRGRTCDRPLCARCAIVVGRHDDGDSVDYCHAHALHTGGQMVEAPVSPRGP